MAGVVARFERQAPGLVVLTERDVTVVDERGRSARRWPDLLLRSDGGLVAVELELTLKTKDRLRRIVDGYAASDLAEVRWLVGSPTISRRIRRLPDLAALPSHGHGVHTPRVVIKPWETVEPPQDRTPPMW